MKALLLVLALGAALPVRSAAASDAAVVAAALPDEASECRYLLQINRDFEAALAAHQLDRYQALAGDRFDAAKVVRAKHDHMPACFHELDMKLDGLE